MSWIKENTFLSAFLAFVAVAAAVLAFLTFSAKGGYDKVSQTYDRQAAELATLQRKEPYPNEENLEAMKQSAARYGAAVSQLLSTLSALEIEPPQMSPEEFQRTLAASVAAVTEKARENGVKMPDTFYMGFEPYQSQLPAQDLAPQLGRQLAAMQMAIEALLENKPVSLDDLERVPLPSEPGAKAPKAGDLEPAAAGSLLVEEQPFSIDFTIDPIRLRRFMNDVATARRQFFIVRNVQIANEQPKSPPRAASPAPAGAFVPPPPADDAPALPEAELAPEQPAARREYLFGDEKVSVKALIGIVDFAGTESAATQE